MTLFRRKCRYCRRWFQAGRCTQKICSRPRCQKDRHRRSCLIWHKKHPHRDQKRRLKIRGWAKAYPTYWKRYRASHPDYSERERQRMRRKRRRAQGVAKRDARRMLAVEKLAAIAAQKPKNVAKRDACDRRMDKVLSFLIWKEASQNGTQRRAA